VKEWQGLRQRDYRLLNKITHIPDRFPIDLPVIAPLKAKLFGKKA